MLILINGFELDHWIDHNKQCYARNFSLWNTPGQTISGFTYCSKQLFRENKTGNVYSPSRNITNTPVIFKGEPSAYWDAVKPILQSGFRDDRIFFVNGSSDNRSTGKYRFEIGIEIGNNLIKALEAGEKSENPDFCSLPPYKPAPDLFLNFVQGSSPGGFINFLKHWQQQGMQEYKKARLCAPHETIKLVGHSMGAAMAAGIATALSRSRFASRLEVVLYLAPHQPQDFVHPAGIPAYQSSSAEDLVASKNELYAGSYGYADPMAIAAANLFRKPDQQLPYTMDLNIPLAWAKGKTAYTVIKNVPVQNFIVNSTHTGIAKSQRGHSVSTYDDELKKFFQQYRSVR